MSIFKKSTYQIKDFCLRHKSLLAALLFTGLTILVASQNVPKENNKVRNANVCRGTRIATSPITDYGSYVEDKYTINQESSENGEAPDNAKKDANESITAPNIPENERGQLEDDVNAAVNAALTEKKQEVKIEEAKKIFDNGWGISAGGDLIYWDQSSLDRYFQELKTLGASWIRWDVDWEVVQPYSATTYNWGGTDRIAQTAKKYGIKSLGIITYAPQWSQNSICPSGKHCPPSNPQLFARFAGETAERYKGTVDAWEIWNEPNYHVFWSPAPDAYAYADLLKASYEEIKKKNPDAIIISGGLANAADEEGISISPITFVNALYETEAKDSFDILALHPYTYPGPSYGWPQIISVWNVMERNKDKEKKIWITEYGAPTGGSGKMFEMGQNTAENSFIYGKDYMSEKAQNQMAQDISVFKSNNSDRIGNVFWYSLCDSSDNISNSSENFFGILRYDGSKKPVYETLKNIFKKS